MMRSEHLLGLLLLLQDVVCNDYPTECPLVLQPSTVVVRYGDPVSVNCTLSGQHEGIGWEALEGSVDMTEGVQFITWSLEALTDWLIAPRCFGNLLTHGAHFQCTEKLNITLYKPPDSVSISAVNHTGPMLEGKQYQLQCEVQNIAPIQNLAVKWYRGERELQRHVFYDDSTKTPVNVSSTLLITPTSADDGAQYSCVAELELGLEGPQPPPEVKSDLLNINVLYEPHITKCLVFKKLREGETLDTLASCRAEGNPSPVVTWYRNQSEFNISRPLTRRNGGQYTLIAKNSYGTASHTLEVEVLYPPIFAQEKELVNLTEGDEVILECLAEGNPTPELSWSTTATENPRVSARGRQSNATISSATSATAGVYTCNARNDLGLASKTVTVTVKEKDAAEWGYIQIFLVLTGTVFILVLLLLLIVWLISFIKNQGHYYTV